MKNKDLDYAVWYASFDLNWSSVKGDINKSIQNYTCYSVTEIVSETVLGPVADTIWSSIMGSIQKHIRLCEAMQ